MAASVSRGGRLADVANDQIFDDEESRREAAAAPAEIRSRQGFSSGPRNSALNLQPAAGPRLTSKASGKSSALEAGLSSSRHCSPTGT